MNRYTRHFAVSLPVIVYFFHSIHVRLRFDSLRAYHLCWFNGRLK